MVSSIHYNLVDKSERELRLALAEVRSLNATFRMHAKDTRAHQFITLFDFRDFSNSNILHVCTLTPCFTTELAVEYR